MYILCFTLLYKEPQDFDCLIINTKARGDIGDKYYLQKYTENLVPMISN